MMSVGMPSSTMRALICDLGLPSSCLSTSFPVARYWSLFLTISAARCCFSSSRCLSSSAVSSVFPAWICSSYLPALMSAIVSRACFPSTRMPMLSHVPQISLTRAKLSLPRRSSCFIFEILMICSILRSATLSARGLPLPVSMPASFLMSALAGGVPTVIVNVFVSLSTVTVMGTCMPLNSAVFLFISETTWPMLTPSGPSAGPSGGAALALPPSTSVSTDCVAIVLRNCGLFIKLSSWRYGVVAHALNVVGVCYWCFFCVSSDDFDGVHFQADRDGNCSF